MTAPHTGPSHAPSRRSRGGRRRRAFSLLASLVIHLLLAGVIVGVPGLLCTPERERIGSDELDVELVAPRLAPPIESVGQQGDRPGRASAARKRSRGLTRGQPQQREADRRPRGDRAASASSWAVAQQERDRVQQEQRRQQASARQDAALAERRERQEEQRRQQAPARRDAALAERRERQRQRDQERQRDGAPRKGDRTLLVGVAAPADDMPRLVPLRQEELGDSPLFHPTLPAERQAPADEAGQTLPEGPSPAAMLDAIQREADQRRQQHRAALAASRQRFAAAERRFAAIARQTGRTARCSAGTFQGIAVGLGGHDVHGRRDQLGGRAPRYGLKFYLSGRRVRTSKVVRPPELLNMPRVQCKVTSLTITPAMVRMLVETDGKVGHLYLKHSSGSKRFDRCALSHARKMRFRPGTDETGLALNVWINLRVEPGLLTTAGL